MTMIVIVIVIVIVIMTAIVTMIVAILSTNCRVEFSGCDNYVVDEFTNEFVRINGIIYNLTKQFYGFKI
jgi:hypothetical protein